MEQQLERLATLFTAQMQMIQQQEAQQRVRDEAHQQEMRALLSGIAGAAPSRSTRDGEPVQTTKLHNSVVTPPFFNINDLSCVYCTFTSVIIVFIILYSLTESRMY